MRAFKVRSADGLTLSVHAAGNPAGPAILFIHGYNQCYLSWQRQFDDPALLSAFHMVALDLRGHGASGQPLDPQCYADDRRWADDIAAVIAAAGLERPVLVNWSYGGRVLTDYVRHHGIAQIGGINFVAAYTSTDASLHGPAFVHFADTLSDDIAVSIAATRAFVHACFEVKPARDQFETILAYNMLMPAKVRALVRDRTHNPGDLLPTLRLPVLVTHGDRDQLSLPARADYTAARVPGARLSMYAGIGHAPFYEDAPRFNRELAEFVRAAVR